MTLQIIILIKNYFYFYQKLFRILLYANNIGEKTIEREGEKG